MHNVRSQSMTACTTALFLAALAALAGCSGGGGSDSGPVAGPAAATPAPVDPSLARGGMHAACTGCGASDDSTYSGSGTGIWQAFNTSSAAQNVPVSIKGLDGQNVTYVFTNEGAAAQTMASMQLNAAPSNSQTGVLPAWARPNAATTGSGEDPALAAIRDFNYRGWTAFVANPKAGAAAGTSFSANAATPGYAVGAQRTFYHQDFSIRQTMLARTMQTSDGTTVNLWVENGELGANKVSPALIDTLITRYAQPGGVYDMLTRVGGPLYGPNPHAELIDGANQPIDLVVMNFDRNGQSPGLTGYFWSLNHFKPESRGLAYSNQSISLYLDSETLYLGGTTGLQQVTTTMAHESMHMQNFYRRSVLMGSQYAYAPWLEEMTAAMMEDWASTNLDPRYHVTRDLRFPSYMTYAGHGSYNCSLTNWTPYAAACESYSVAGSFGGFLDRQLGLGFYQTLLNNRSRTDSLAILNEAIAIARPGSNVQQELRHFAAAAAGLVPAGSAGVSDYLFAARSEGGFNLPAIDPSAYRDGSRRLPTTMPAALLPLGNFPVLHPAVRGTFDEIVQVPAGTTLSVIVD